MTWSKRKSTIYTEAKKAAARQNIVKYEWAQRLRDEAVEIAEPYVEAGWERLWQSIPPYTLPRSYGVNQKRGSIVTGLTLNQFGNYPYRADPLGRPWKLFDPSCSMWFPTNDFEAYYKSGLDAHGLFRPKLADRSLLVNTLYPERGPEWGVDDGFGWIDSEGHVFTFIAHYIHMFLWYGGDNCLVTVGLKALKEAYLYTGDLKYARAGIVLLDRIADVYPALDTSLHNPQVFLVCDGGTPEGKGKATGSIWETFVIKELLYAYDAFLPELDNPETIAFLSEKAAVCQLDVDKSNGETIRLHMEQSIVRQVYPAIRNGQILGNTGMHERAAALAAVVLDSPPETVEWLDFVFQPNEAGDGIRQALVDKVDRDGHGDESAPSYNSLWLDSFAELAELLEDCRHYNQGVLWNHVKFKKMFDSFIPLVMLGRYTPSIGDSGTTGQPGLVGHSARLLVKAFEKYGDPIYAQAAYLFGGNSWDKVHGGIFQADQDGLIARMKAAVAAQGPLTLPSTNLSGYGLAALRDDGEPHGQGTWSGHGQGNGLAQGGGQKGWQSHEDGRGNEQFQRTLWMYYGQSDGHGHADTLNIGLYAYGLDLMPDLGYPEFADKRDMHRFHWVRNTISHNTVMVDRRQQAVQRVAIPLHYDDCGRVKLIDVEAPKAYPHVRRYRRTTAMIRIDDRDSYAIDLFRVAGGREHHFSFHGPEGAVATEGLACVEQPGGTLAGADVPYGERADDIAGPGYKGHGLHYLQRVERDVAPPEQFSLDWTAVDTWHVHDAAVAVADATDATVAAVAADVRAGAAVTTDAADSHGAADPAVAGPIHLRLTMLGAYDEVALADGVPPRNKPGNPASLRYAIVRRGDGEEELDSLFLSVIEPYRKERRIVSIAAVTAERDSYGGGDRSEAAAVKLVLDNGRTDYVVCSTDPDSIYWIDGKFAFRGFFGVYAEESEGPVYGYLHDGDLLGPLSEPLLRPTKGRLEGTVVDFTRQLSMQNEITVQMELQGSLPSELIGVSLYVQGDGEGNAVYTIQGFTSIGEGLYRLDIGDSTLIRRYREDKAREFIYDISVGDAVVIPLSHSWEKE
ncbi:heparinase II/III domain-containing protein [Paenibacillus koleovorans]|uniref:heparinase II/III domain-containing protein n=1 Tax=Paenibacillus koleovorans TaxID=121608 RepID=UPI000FD85C8A|nr:heparinase II/III family protein [Paenibacillus koleovorans]